MKGWKKLLLGAGLFALGGYAAAGCGPSGASLCDARCNCEACPSAVYNDCRISFDDDARLSDSRGCAPFYGDLVSCEDATGFCHSDHRWETSCGAERDRWKRCVGK